MASVPREEQPPFTRADQARVECIGVNPLDCRRVDVAADLTPCLEPVTVEFAIVGPTGEELCTASIVACRDTAVDRVLHLRRDAGPGEHILHVGLFREGRLIHRAEKRFAFDAAPPPRVV